MTAREIRAEESKDTTITIIDTFSGTGGTVESAREVTRKTAIPTKVIMACEIDKKMSESITRRHNIPCHDDIRTLTVMTTLRASILMATPPCQDWSIAGHALGPEGKHAYTIEALLEIVRTQQFDMIVMEQVPGMQSWCGPGEHLKDGTDGPVFKALRREFEKNGYHFQWIKIQIAHLHIPQFRERLAIVATHERVTKAVGTMNLQLPVKQQHSQIGPFLLSNPRFYSKVAPISELQPDPGQRHQDYKPHKIGYYGDAEVWGEKGLSPCIRTANEVLVGLGDWIVKIEVQGMAALQGIPITDLPPDVHEARRQIGNAIHRDMGTFVLTQVVQHIHQYKRHIGVETPMSNDAEISTDTEAQALTIPPTFGPAARPSTTSESHGEGQQDAQQQLRENQEASRLDMLPLRRPTCKLPSFTLDSESHGILPRRRTDRRQRSK